MQKQNGAQKAKASATVQEDLKPLISKLDLVCKRLEVIEAIGELCYQWKKVDNHEPELSSPCLGSIGEFILNETLEMRHEISGEVMDKLSMIENGKEAQS